MECRACSFGYALWRSPWPMRRASRSPSIWVREWRGNWNYRKRRTMTDKKRPRPPRFDDIAARSHRPPIRRPDSIFAAAYDAEEAQKKAAAALEKVSADDFPILPQD